MAGTAGSGQNLGAPRAGFRVRLFVPYEGARTMSVLTTAPGAPAADEEPPDTGDRHRLTAVTGPAALSLDAMASVAYGPEAIVLVLAAAGAHGLGFTLPVTLAIAALLAVLVASYRQVIAAFPDGGGSYAVARTHLGRRTSLVAAASLVLDYVLNVAVAVTAGVAALTSAFPALHDDRLWLRLAVLALVTAVNLRDVMAAEPATRVTVLIPETEPERLWQRLLQNQRGAVVVAHAVRRETDGAICRLRFRLS